MPNIANAFKEEITRLARKELRSETDGLKKSIASYRSQIAALKRRVDALERQQKRDGKVVAKATQQKEDQQDARLRFRSDGFAQHRARLGLSAREMGILLDASPLSVYKWEAGQAKPRAKHLAAIAAVRKMGKREAAQRLEELAVA